MELIIMKDEMMAWEEPIGPGKSQEIQGGRLW
jgi:hypothetical protein